MQEIIDALENKDASAEQTVQNVDGMITQLFYSTRVPPSEITKDNAYWLKIKIKLKTGDPQKAIDLVKAELVSLIKSQFPTYSPELKKRKVGASTQELEQKEKDEIPQDFLKEFEGIERYDPPFFKLTMHGSNRVIYVLGSIHPRHPQLLLSKNVFTIIKDIVPTCTLFTEHDNTKMEKVLFEKFQEPHLQEPSEKWDPIITFSLDNIKQETWERVKDKFIDAKNTISINKITELPCVYGTMLVYFRSVKRPVFPKKEELSMPGYEKTIKKWHGDKGTLFLETPEEFFNSFSQDLGTLKTFFINGIDRFDDKLTNEKSDDIIGALIRKQKLISDYKISIKKYDYARYMSEKINTSTKERNIIWKEHISNYLRENQDTNPVFIVCGVGHLHGGLKDGSFLELLLETGLFSEILRMDIEGNWKSV